MNKARVLATSIFFLLKYYDDFCNDIAKTETKTDKEIIGFDLDLLIEKIVKFKHTQENADELLSQLKLLCSLDKAEQLDIDFLQGAYIETCFNTLAEEDID